MLDSAALNAHNGCVHGRIKRLVVASALLFVSASIVAGPLADFRGSAEAMSCCAKTDYNCAGISGPDDCCRHMGHTAHGLPAGTVSDTRSLQSSVATVSPTFFDVALSTLRSVDTVSAFKRPHDPPHLHTHILLI
jgi:hypothetical protein